jgi:hypothetical protein
MAMGEYRLYDLGTTALLGCFSPAVSAWAVADEHALAELQRAGDWITIEHVVVSRPAGRRPDVSSELKHLGPADDIDGCRAWLKSLPGRS